ncbi:DnaB-like helicase C-terminal domain-containing protein [Sebaldella sp. S0638]|uniref:DnaB-like helicase C-terminal domain-containing protein n=1 Tax=Sebaldella sp. S0638 TaxID=2957809 RepID=UPI0020A16740|nr:DnaB-like helicase C-terminal domain-containing protein [Sebaldella sp. S0638]MCP1226519.1 DnaB-like helicase C-terminal domain-containing protein [Sebaldella sp. S0638]
MAELSIEKAILGKILSAPYTFESAVENGLKEQYFVNNENREIYKQMLKIYTENGVFEQSFLKVPREKLIELAEESNGVVHMNLGVKVLRDEYKNYYMDKKIQKVLETEDLSVDEKRKNIITIVERLGDFEEESNKLVTPRGLLSEWWTDLEKKELDGIYTGYSDLDKYVFLEKGSLITIGARPSMGKTAFGLNLAYKNAVKHNVLYVNIEMNTKQITNRILASMSGVLLKKIKKTKGEVLTDEDIAAISRKMSMFEKLKLGILDCKNNNFEIIVQGIKKAHEKTPLALIVIDYLTLMQAKGYSNKNIEVEEMANRLKALAKELDTCIVVLAQLNRDVEKRPDKRPVLMDLRDSGGIEQASNVVMFLHREDYYKTPNSEKKLSMMEVIIRKNRDGELGTVSLVFNKETQEIRTLQKQPKLIDVGDDEDDKRRRPY